MKGIGNINNSLTKFGCEIIQRNSFGELLIALKVIIYNRVEMS